ncbi:MAG: tandem-95 repeat protein, partial [Planctomycetes bacterium]|nr:tandem-95 repeat protein [Planctomycetota bacterium]
SFLDGVASPEVVVTYVITGVNNVGATPTFSPAPGTYSAPLSVALASTTPGTTIHFSIDGTEPTAASPTYTSPISISSNTTVRARGFANGYFEGAVAVGVYSFRVAQPTGSPVAGTYTAPTDVTLSSATPSAVIRFTEDGSQPTGTSTIASGPIHLASSATITARAFRTGWTESTSLVASYVIANQPANQPPAFVKGADQTALEDSGLRTVSGWATAISAGPASEAGQVVTFQITVDTPTLFSVQPAVSSVGTLTFTPAANAYGTAVVSVNAKDNGGVANGGVDTSLDQTFVIVVTPVNDAPTFTLGADRIAVEDAAATSVAGYASAISAGPANETGQVVSFTVSASTSSLFSVAPAIDAAGTLTFTPAPDANGSAVITVVAHDSGGVANGGTDTSVARTGTITVTAVNDAPSFTKGADQTVLEDAGAQTVSGWATAIAAGPADESAQSVTFTVTTDNVALFAVAPTLSHAGVLSYTPVADANGVATITVVAHDNGGVANGGVSASAAQTATITVTTVNDAPSFTKGANQTVLEDAGAQSVVLWATAVSAGPANEVDQIVSFTVTTDNAALFAVAPAVSTDGTLSYTPALDANGVATISVITRDSGGVANGGVSASAAQTATISVTAVNDAPSFTKGANQTVLEDAGAQTISGWATAITAGPADEASQSLTFTVITDNAALFAVAPAVSPSGVLSYTSASNANGVATITMVAHDDGGTANSGVSASAAQTATITVTAVNDVPTGSADSYTTTRGAALTVAADAGVLANDVDIEGSPLTAVLVSTTTSGVLVLNASGSFTYTPTGYFTGTDHFSYRASDGSDASAITDVTITVTVPPNHAPVAVPDSYSVAEDTLLTVPDFRGVIQNDTDEEMQFLSATLVTSTSHGTLTLAEDGGFTYAPNAEYSGADSFTYRASDGDLVSNIAVVTITVTAVNDAPVAVADSYVIAEDSTLTVSTSAGVLANDSDVDSPVLVAVLSGLPSHGTLVLASDGSFTYVPAADFSGSDAFTYRAGDGDLQSPVTSVAITLTAVNDAPITVADAFPATEDAILTVPADSGVLANDHDVDGPSLSAVLVAAPPASDGILVLASDGSVTFTPVANRNGPVTFTYRASDGELQSAITTATISIAPVNDRPSFQKGADQVVEHNAGTVTISGWATAISAGPGNEAGQQLTFEVTAVDSTLFSTQPAISAAGTLTYAPQTGISGATTLTVTLVDDGGTLGGGIDRSLPASVNVVVHGPVQAVTAAFATASGSVSEAVDTVRIPVVLSGPAPSEVSIGYSVAGTATSSQAVVSPGPLLIPAGQSSGDIVISVVDDDVQQPARTVELTLTSASGATLGASRSHTLTITDNDAPADETVSFTTATSSVGELDGSATDILLSLSSTSVTDRMIEWSVTGGTALRTRYLASSGSVLIPAGSLTAALPFQVMDNSLLDGDATVIIDIAATGGARVGSVARHVLTIVDDELTTNATFLVASASALESNSVPVSIQVQLSRAVPRTVVIGFRVVPGTALIDDYNGFFLPTSLTFAPGQTQRTMSLTLSEDSDFVDETFGVDLLDPPGADSVGPIAHLDFTIRDHLPTPGFLPDPGLIQDGKTGLFLDSGSVALVPGDIGSVFYTIGPVGTALADPVPGTVGTVAYSAGDAILFSASSIIKAVTLVGSQRSAVVARAYDVVPQGSTGTYVLTDSPSSGPTPVSPVCVAYGNAPNGSGVAMRRVGPEGTTEIGYTKLGEKALFANVPLSPAGPVTVGLGVTQADKALNRSETYSWLITDLSTKTPSDRLVIRRNDSLRFTSTIAGGVGSLVITGSSSHQPVTGTPGEGIVVTYAVPAGSYTATATVGGASAGSMTIIVVDPMFVETGELIAAEIDNERTYMHDVSPIAALGDVSFVSLQPDVLTVGSSSPNDGTGISSTLKALKRGTPFLIARLTASKAIIGVHEVEEFKVEHDALVGAAVPAASSSGGSGGSGSGGPPGGGSGGMPGGPPIGGGPPSGGGTAPSAPSGPSFAYSGFIIEPVSALLRAGLSITLTGNVNAVTPASSMTVRPDVASGDQWAYLPLTFTLSAGTTYTTQWKQRRFPANTTSAFDGFGSPRTIGIIQSTASAGYTIATPGFVGIDANGQIVTRAPVYAYSWSVSNPFIAKDVTLSSYSEVIERHTQYPLPLFYDSRVSLSLSYNWRKVSSTAIFGLSETTTMGSLNGRITAFALSGTHPMTDTVRPVFQLPSSGELSLTVTAVQTSLGAPGIKAVGMILTGPGQPGLDQSTVFIHDDGNADPTIIRYPGTHSCEMYFVGVRTHNAVFDVNGVRPTVNKSPPPSGSIRIPITIDHVFLGSAFQNMPATITLDHDRVHFFAQPTGTTPASMTIASFPGTVYAEFLRDDAVTMSVIINGITEKFVVSQITEGKGPADGLTGSVSVLSGMASVDAWSGNFCMALPIASFPTPLMGPDTALTYNSLDGIDIGHGCGWRTTYDMRLYGSVLIDGSGTRTTFLSETASGTSRYVGAKLHANTKLGADLTLFKGTETNVFLPNDNRRYFFDDKGFLVRIQNIQGQELTITHDDKSATKVADAFGRAVDLTALAGSTRIDAIDQPVSGKWSFGYDDKERLNRVTQLDGSDEHFSGASSRVWTIDYNSLSQVEKLTAPSVAAPQPDGSSESQVFYHGFDYANKQFADTATIKVPSESGETTAAIYVFQAGLDGWKTCTDAVGVTRTRTFVAGRRLIATSSGGSDSAMQYTYDAKGNVTQSVAVNGGGPQTRIISTYGDLGILGANLKLTSTVVGTTGVEGAVGAMDLVTTWSYLTDGGRAGLPATMTDPCNAITAWTYTSQGFLATETDPLGHATVYSGHNQYGHPSTVTSPLGRKTTQVWNPDTQLLASQTDVTMGFTTAYTYNSHRRVMTTTGPGSVATTTSYDPMGHVITSTDAGGFTTTYAYDAEGRMVSATPAGQPAATTFYKRSGNGWLITNRVGTEDQGRQQIDGIGRVTQMIVKRELTVGSGTRTDCVSSNEYDAATGRLSASVDARGKRTTFTYDGAGRMVMAVPPGESLGTSVTCNAIGWVLTSTTADNEITRFTYDACGRPRVQTNPLGGFVASIYDPAGRLTITMPSIGRGAGYEYDDDGLQTATVDRHGRRIETSIAKGRITTQDTARAEIKRVQDLDDRGYVAKVTTGNGATILDHANDGFTTRVKPLGRSAQRAERDTAGRTIANFAEGATGARELASYVTYRTDSGRPDKTISANGSVRKALTDPQTGDYQGSADNVAAADDDPAATAPVGTIVTVDPVGNVLVAKDGEQRATTTTYDDQGRAKTRSLPSGLTMAWEYTPGGKLRKTTRSGPGVNESTTYTYDQLGQRKDATHSTLGMISTTLRNQHGEVIRSTGVDSYVEYTYDPVTRDLIKERRNGDQVMVYVYDDRGLLISKRSGTVGRGDPQYLVTPQEAGLPEVASYRYDGQDRRTRTVYPGGAIESTSYAANGDVATVTDRGGAVHAFSFDSHGRRASEVVTATGKPTQTTTYSYEYSEAGTVVLNGQAVPIAKGLRTTTTQDGISSVTESDRRGRVTLVQHGSDPATTYAYNNADEPIQRGSLALTYQINGLLGSIAGEGMNATFTYDGSGRLATETVGGVVRTYVYDGASRVASMTQTTAANGAESHAAVRDATGRILRLTDPEGVSRYVYDQRGHLAAERRIGASSQVQAFCFDGNDNRTGQLIAVASGSPAGVFDRDWTTSMPQISAASGGSWTVGSSVTVDATGSASATLILGSAVGPWISLRPQPDQTLLGSHTRSAGIGFGDTLGGRYDVVESMSQGTSGLQVRLAIVHGARVVAVSDAIAYDSGAILVTVRRPGSQLLAEIQNAQGLYLVRVEAGCPDGIDGAVSLVSNSDTPTDSANARFDDFHWDNAGTISRRSFAYDVTDHLQSSVDTTNTRVTTRTYAYDGAGNQESVTESVVDGGSAQPSELTTFTYDAMNRLIGVSGHPVSGGSTTTASYAYAPNSWKRLSQTVDGITTSYTWDGNDIGAEVTNGVRTTYGYCGSVPLWQQSSLGDGVAYGKDLLGNVTGLCGPIAGYPQLQGYQRKFHYDAFGNVREDVLTGAQTQTLPDGTVVATSVNYAPTAATAGKRYRGEQRDATGLTYLRHRYYDPGVGRFTQSDPARAGSNWYAYCGGDPVNRSDPSGLDWEWSPNNSVEQNPESSWQYVEGTNPYVPKPLLSPGEMGGIDYVDAGTYQAVRDAYFGSMYDDTEAQLMESDATFGVLLAFNPQYRQFANLTGPFELPGFLDSTEKVTATAAGVGPRSAHSSAAITAYYSARRANSDLARAVRSIEFDRYLASRHDGFEVPEAIGSRVSGAGRIAGGGAGIVSAIGLTETGIGAIPAVPLAAWSGDQIGTGLREIWNGQYQSSLGGRAATAVFGDSTAGHVAEFGYDVLPNFVGLLRYGAVRGGLRSIESRYTYGAPVGGSFRDGVGFKLRSQLGLIGRPEQLHHWLIPQNQWGKYVPNFIKNRRWNLVVTADRAAHARIDTAFSVRGVAPYPLIFRPFIAMPNWARATAAGTAGGLGYWGSEYFDGP